jgi:uncharacterized protein YlxW (UPF0749 family)
MVKKKKQSLEDIMDRIQEDMDTLRDRIYDLENQADSDSDGPEDWDDEDSEDEDSDEE